MKKTAFLFTIFGLSIHYSAICQLFVNASNEWYIDECCHSQGEINCTTYKFSFGDIVIIDNLEYRQLITNFPDSGFSNGEFYRESDGRVFMKRSQNDDDVLIYDFNLELGQQLEIGSDNSAFLIKVISIDSVTLNSGEHRKRIELGLASNLAVKTYWIEGIGSELSTMNTEYMFTSDCWNELNCYHKDNLIEYQLGDCELTNTKESYLLDYGFSIFPNPADNQIILKPDENRKIVFVELLDLNGKTLIKMENAEIHNVKVSELQKGMYLVKVGFKNGYIGFSKFIKK